jgi:large subunit ribosomal protein L10
MRQEKQLLLDEIESEIGESKPFIVLSYSKFGANLSNTFRGEIQKLGGTFTMVRKRVLVKAAKSKGIELSVEQLPGHIGVVAGGHDLLETAKFLFKFGKDNEKAIEVQGGRFEGKYHSASTIEKLSKLPGKDEMRAQFLATLQAPLAETLSVMEAILVSVMHCLENKSEKEGGSEA